VTAHLRRAWNETPTPSATAEPHDSAPARTTLLALAILLLMGVVMLTTIARLGITNDEIVHIPAGYIALTTGDFRPNNEQPPLPKLLAALPLLPLHLTVPPPSAEPWDDPAGRSTVRASAFWEANRGQFAAISFWARVPAIGLTLLLGWLIFAYGRTLFGARAALLALVLYSVEPTILAHGRVVHTDLPAALGLFLGAIATHAYLRAPSARRAVLLGAAIGAGLLTKFSLLVFAPLPLIALLIGGRVRRPAIGWRALAGHAALVVVLALAVVNLAYGVSRQPLGADDRAWILGTPPSLPRAVLLGASPLTALLPTDFIYGLYYQFLHDQQGHVAALFDRVSTTGWWYYFPVAFALKTTLPFLALSLGGLAWALWRVGRRDWRFVALLLPLALFIALALNSRINIGIRHFLPAYPFFCLLGGALLAAILALRPSPRVRWLPRAIVTATLGWTIIEAALIYPNYLPYMNALTLGRPHWQLLGDSNLEWGENIPALADYLHAHGETAITAATSAGWQTLQLQGITYYPLLAANSENDVTTRYVAVGASFLSGSNVPRGMRERFLAIYRNETPEATFGGTIFLYRTHPAAPPLTAPLPAGTFRATITVANPPVRLTPGAMATLLVRVRNDGDRPWPTARDGIVRYDIHLGNHWLAVSGGKSADDDARAVLPFTIAPGEAVTLPLQITAPTTTGAYTLEIDLVQEGVAWALADGNTPARFTVQVQP
jgi:4-amino-4-deoxy-L-arabinose transferase-like glycosyltransferase